MPRAGRSSPAQFAFLTDDGLKSRRMLKCSPKLGQLMLEFSGVLKCSPKLGQLMLEFSGV
jgi:hypothetical protein